ncbi:MAG: proteasome-type protease [Thiobacillus sp.]
MTYCLAIKTNTGIVFASDSRTNAGVDYIRTYSKMHVFAKPDDRILVLLASGNLATTQAVVNTIQNDIEDEAPKSLLTCRHLHDAAKYIGEISRKEQLQHAAAFQDAGSNGSTSATMILGGQIAGRPADIFLIYPEGNYISASPETPYLQIGETKYGKPILDRIVTPATTLEDAARCAMVSLDSTMRANLSVGPPLELSIYRADSLAMPTHRVFKLQSPFIKSMQKSWGEGLQRAFKRLPRFDWEDQKNA